MTKQTEKSVAKQQFALADVFFVTFCFAVAMALGVWSLESNWLSSTDALPILFYPSIPVLITGILFAPLMSLGMLFVVVLLMVGCSPRPLSPLIFLGLIPFAFFANALESPSRYLAALLIACLAMVIEPLFREVDRKWKYIPVLCLAVTLCFYWFVVCAIASAGV